MKQRPVLFSNDDDEAATRLPTTSFSASGVRLSNGISASGISGMVSRSYPESLDSVEIPETPSATEPSRCPVYPSVVRVMGKRLSSSGSGYLVLCWVNSCRGEATCPELERHFWEYDEKISRDRARRERLISPRESSPPACHLSKPTSSRLALSISSHTRISQESYSWCSPQSSGLSPPKDEYTRFERFDAYLMHRNLSRKAVQTVSDSYPLSIRDRSLILLLLTHLSM